MSKYLLEIGTEELPYKFIPQAIEQLKSGFEKFFQAQKIDFDSVEVLATPRRLTVIVDGLPVKQPDEEKILKGPIKNVAYDENGNLSRAGAGFATKCKVSESDLFIQDNYLHAKVFNKGKLTADVLKENVSELVLKLQGPYFMRWAGFDEKFSRPIRWVVSILDSQEVPIKIVDVQSSKISRGHRFSNTSVEISNPDEYQEKLRAAHVIVNQDERKSLIEDLTQKEAKKLGVKAFYDEDLLDEVTYLCEYPMPVVCDFDAKYLDIPQKVTVTVMASHQRYFALFDGEKLVNKFITITNFIGDDFSNIKAGNERVITARLDDAIFFYKEDTKKPFDNFVENLKGVTFQKGMGSVYDKTQRIIKLAEIISSRLGVKSPSIERTALLCKADLTTSLVFEFTELQGYIGADYAKISGEDLKIVEGIKEHYFPLNAESELAQGIEGQIVGIADKLDTICAVFLDGKKPTGSSDPLGVRRAALGIIKTIINKNLNLDLSELIKNSVELLPKKPENENILLEQVEEFFVQRMIIFLSEFYKKEILEACAANKNPLVNLCDFVKRVNLVEGMMEDKTFAPMFESANRISRILKDAAFSKVDEKLFAHDSERKLFEQIKLIDDSTYEKLLGSLKSLNPYVEKFFEDVLVMDKDLNIKENRISMLGMLKNSYNQVADFTTLQI